VASVRETARYCLFAASIDPESPKAFQGGAVVKEARGERLKAKSTLQREHDTMGGGMGKVVSVSLRGVLSSTTCIYKTGKRKFDRTLLSDSRFISLFVLAHKLPVTRRVTQTRP
jgi:hypothetical protein